MRFFERHLVHTKDRWAGKPFILDAWQRDEIIVPVFGTVDEQGLRIIREGLVGTARKNGKSHIGAGTALYGTFADGHYTPDMEWVPLLGGEVYGLAPSRDQARIIFDVAAGMVSASPVLSSMAKVYRNAIEVKETGTVYRVLSSDASMAHGYNPSMVVIDELHLHPSSDLYEAMRTGTAAREQPLILSFTTAGWDRTTLCYKLYKYGKSKKRRRSFFFYWAEPSNANAPVTDRKARREANPAKHVTAKYLNAQLGSPEMTESTYRRLHMNQWTSQQQRVLPMDKWDACAAQPIFPPGCEVIIGVDVAPRGQDRTAIGLTRRDEKRQIHAKVTLMGADPATGIVDYEYIEDMLRSYAKAFDVREIVYDPYYFDRSAVILSSEGLPVVEFPQSDVRMIPASQALYAVVMGGRLRHGGDAALREHADNAGAKDGARGWRFHKPNSSGAIDGIIALTMAISRWESEESEDASIRVMGESA